MTTYPLSEPATIYPAKTRGDATSAVIGQGTLEECAEIVAALPSDKQRSIVIQMDDLDLKFDAHDISELLRFLHEETPGLSNTEITEIRSPDSLLHRALAIANLRRVAAKMVWDLPIADQPWGPATCA